MEYHGETGYQVAKRIKRFSFSKMKDAKQGFRFLNDLNNNRNKTCFPQMGTQMTDFLWLGKALQIDHNFSAISFQNSRPFNYYSSK